MRFWIFIASTIAIGLILQACSPKSQNDCGYIQNVYGERVSWKSSKPIDMQLHESVPDSMVPAILAAADTWHRTLGRKVINVVISPRVLGPMNPRQDSKNVIYLMDTWESNKLSEQGRTSLYWIGDEIKEADIRLNGADFGYYWQGQNLTQSSRTMKTTSLDVNIEALVLHEMGHVLGLKHRDNVGSVMATYLASGDDRVQLSASDTQALQCEY